MANRQRARQRRVHGNRRYVPRRAINAGGHKGQAIVFDRPCVQRGPTEAVPATIALVVSPTERARLNADQSRKRWADVTPITQVGTLNPFRANYRHADGAQELALVAKGDFNGDAIEDALMTSRDSVDNGSYGAVRLFLVTRTSATGDVTVLNEYLR